MFHFPAFPPHTLCIQMRVTRHHSCRVSPFGHPRINARLAAPRGLSQPPTSFIGSQCQGIHHAPLNTYNDISAQKLCTNQFGKIAHQTQQHTPEGNVSLRFDARNHYPQIKHHTPPPKTGRQQLRPHHCEATPRRGHRGLLSQSPIVCLAIPPPASPPNSRLLCTKPQATTACGFLTAPPPPNGAAFSWCSLERR